jgi:hypothetical protein
LDSDALIRYETPEAHLITPDALCHSPLANTARAKDRLEKRRPPLSKRRSPKRPRDLLVASCICDPPVESAFDQRITQLSVRESYLHSASQYAAREV